MRGEVVSVGDGVDVEVGVGEVVYFDGYSADAVGENLIVSETDILAVEDSEEEAADVTDIADLDTTEARLEVYKDIEAEREYQDKKWGGSGFDDKQTDDNWVNYIVEYATASDRAAKYDFRTRMVKVAALAVAAIESFDRKVNEMADACCS